MKVLAKIQKILLIVLSLCIVIVVNAQVLCRLILKSDFFGLEEIVIIIAFWLYFIGSSYGSYKKGHISGDLIQSYVKREGLKKAVKIIVSVLSTVICLIVTKWAYDLFLWGLHQKATSTVLSIPMVIPQSAIFVSFLLMSLYSLLYFYQDIIKNILGKE